MKHIRTCVTSIGSILALSGTVLAAPVYLSCTIDGEDGPGYKVTLNEEAGKASELSDDGYSITADAAFSPNEVTYQTSTSDRGFAAFYYSSVIDRTTLSYTRKSLMLSGDGTRKESARPGRCEIEKAPVERAF